MKAGGKASCVFPLRTGRDFFIQGIGQFQPFFPPFFPQGKAPRSGQARSGLSADMPRQAFQRMGKIRIDAGGGNQNELCPIPGAGPSASKKELASKA